MAKVIYTEEAKLLILKVRFDNRNTGFKRLISFEHRTYVPRCTKYSSIKTVKLYNAICWFQYLFYTVGSCQKRAGAFFALPSYWLMISLHVIPVGVSSRDIIFLFYLSSKLYFMDGWVFKRAFLKSYFHIMIKGKTALI